MAKLPLGDLQTLRSLLLPSSAEDPVLVAIDFEGTQYITNGFPPGYRDTQVGLAILDTRGLSSTSKFTTSNFITGEDAYFEKSAPHYRFGAAEKIPVTSMLSRINGCLRVYQDRNIVIVGHGVPGDMVVLKDLKFNFQENQVVARLDTYLLARDLQMGHLSLENLLIKLNCPCNLKFHNAGNDANCSLRALLLLGVKAIEALEGIEATSLGAKASSRGTSNRADILWWVAMGELLSRKMKWCIRRKAARIRTPEEQVELRAKRQQHRELYERTLSYTYGIIPENVSEAETT